MLIEAGWRVKHPAVYTGNRHNTAFSIVRASWHEVAAAFRPQPAPPSIWLRRQAGYDPDVQGRTLLLPSQGPLSQDSGRCQRDARYSVSGRDMMQRRFITHLVRYGLLPAYKPGQLRRTAAGATSGNEKTSAVTLPNRTDIQYTGCLLTHPPVSCPACPQHARHTARSAHWLQLRQNQRSVTQLPYFHRSYPPAGVHPSKPSKANKSEFWGTIYRADP